MPHEAATARYLTQQKKVKTYLYQIEYKGYISPPIFKEKHNHLFISLTLIHKKEDTIFVKLTRKFSLRSVNGNTAIFILYDWASNAILANPIKDAKNYTMVEAFTKNVKYLSACGVKPEYNIMDNVASKEIRNYLSKDKIKLKLVEPHNYRANASKRAIQTFKNHLSLAYSLATKSPPLSYRATSSIRHRIP